MTISKSSFVRNVSMWVITGLISQANFLISPIGAVEVLLVHRRVRIVTTNDGTGKVNQLQLCMMLMTAESPKTTGRETRIKKTSRSRLRLTSDPALNQTSRANNDDAPKHNT